MKIKWLDITRQNKLIKEPFLKLVNEIIDSGNISMGRFCQELEEKWAEMNGAKYCALLSSGTDALTLTIDALSIKGPIITTSLSFIATTNAITLNRKGVIFCDVRGEDANINSLEVLSKMSSQKYFNPVGAILATAMYGCPPDLENLSNIAKQYKIPLIIDCCQAHLSTYKQKNIIDYCDAIIHSFYTTKNIGAITELGALLTNDKNLYENIQSLKNHGRGVNNYEFDEIGYNCRPSEIGAASLLVKLPYIQGWTRRRIEIANIYNKKLKPLKEKHFLKYLEPFDGSECVFHLYPIFVKNRDAIRGKLLELGVETQKQYPLPIHNQKAYIELGQGPFPVSEELCRTVITLPCYPEMTISEIGYVCDSLLKCI